jgi:hypothetical protein
LLIPTAESFCKNKVEIPVPFFARQKGASTYHLCHASTTTSPQKHHNETRIFPKKPRKNAVSPQPEKATQNQQKNLIPL